MSIRSYNNKKMLLSRQVFNFQDKPLIEKIIIQPPFRFETFFQNGACFISLSGSKSTFNSAKEKVTIESKESLLLKCGSYFIDWLKTSSPTKSEIIAVHLYPDVLKKLYKKELPEYIKPKNKKKALQKIVPDNVISKFIESLNFYFDNPSLINDDILELKVKELILVLVQTKNADSILQLISELFTPQKIQIQKVVERHVFSNLSIPKLAELSSLSTSSFKRDFYAIYQQTPVQYINNQRLKKAKELLEISDLSISQIAYQLGFNDPAYFSRLFKNKFNLNPSSFRS
jgi:AraC-like DNA-binding protein